jgi:hypothetical protein
MIGRMITGLISLCLAPTIAAAASTGSLQISIVDAASGALTPARVEVRDAEGNYHVAADAMRFGGDCDMSDAGAGLTDLRSALNAFAVSLHNPYSNSTQFYSEGTASLSLPAGTATVTVSKGPEYRWALLQVDIVAGVTVQKNIEVERWVNMPAAGWYSGDDHVHIQRPDPALNPLISKMMQAEDLHVANLLQMGKVRNFEIAPQYTFGPGSYYQQGNYILATGQETPRTHFLGHTITLGAPKPLFDAENYLIYRLIWEQAAALGGINGYAHAYFSPPNSFGAWEGMALVLPHNLLHFLEVLQFNRSGYEAWYDILNLGYRVTPTAGTDYPCAEQTIVGHERFYTRVEGELTYAKWLDAVRAGRTFVTTGPVARFKVNGRDIGDELIVEPGEKVTIAGEVSFDPERDALFLIEVVKNGDIIARYSRLDGQSTIDFEFEHSVAAPAWFALRGYGSQFNDNPGVSPVHFGSFLPTTNVHTAPVYVSLKGAGGAQRIQPSARVAGEWLVRLEDLERVLSEKNMDELAPRLEFPNFDAVPRDTLMHNRDALLLEIAEAKAFFAALAAD